MLFIIYRSCHIFVLFNQNLSPCLALPIFHTNSISTNLWITILSINWINCSITTLILHTFISIVRFNITQNSRLDILKVLRQSTFTFFLENLLTLTIINYINLISNNKRCMLFADQWLWNSSINPAMINNLLILTLSIVLLWLVYRLICPIRHITSWKTIWLNLISMKCLHIYKRLLILLLKFVRCIMELLDSLLIFFVRLILFLPILLLINNLLNKTLRNLTRLFLLLLIII